MAKNADSVSQEAAGELENTPAVTTLKPEEREPAVSVGEYTAKELIAAHEAFKVPQECVSAALQLAGIKSATESNAAKIIEKFMKQEVKK